MGQTAEKDLDINLENCEFKKFQLDIRFLYIIRFFEKSDFFRDGRYIDAIWKSNVTVEFERTISPATSFICRNKNHSRESVLRGRIYRDCNSTLLLWAEIREIASRLRGIVLFFFFFLAAQRCASLGWKGPESLVAGLASGAYLRAVLLYIP